MIAFAGLVLAAWAQTREPVPDSRLNQCYEKYPFFRQALMEIPDKDFADRKLSAERRRQLRVQIAPAAIEIRSCLQDIVRYAKEQGDPDNVKYVARRMSEISALVYEPSGVTRKGAR